jgi:hypothetical protein
MAYLDLTTGTNSARTFDSLTDDSIQFLEEMHSSAFPERTTVTENLINAYLAREGQEPVGEPFVKTLKLLYVRA